MPYQQRGGMEPGDRDLQITIMERTASDEVDEVGTPIEVWTPLVTMPASKKDLSGEERLQAAQEAASFDTEWEINYRADMDPDLLDIPTLRRVVYKNRTYDIVHASHRGRKEGIVLQTIASTKGGA